MLNDNTIERAITNQTDSSVQIKPAIFLKILQLWEKQQINHLLMELISKNKMINNGIK